MDCNAVLSVLRDAGYSAVSLSAIQEGSNHHVFDVTLEDGTHAICKFAKVRKTELGLTAPNLDTLFGGRLSLDRESYLLSLAREQGGLPAPKIYGTHDSPLGRFVMMEKSPGISFTEWQETQGYRLEPYLSSLRALGRDFGKLHKNIRLPSFGDIIGPNEIEPGCDNFADRFMAVTNMRIERGAKKGAFSQEETSFLTDFFRGRFESLRPYLSAATARPVMVFTDMHGRNYFVDEQGIPSGYFDLESAQAAPAALEFYGFRFFLFNFYDQETFSKAEAAFLEGYQEAGGPCLPKTAEDEALIQLLSGCRLLELAESYWGVVDAIRDTWGARMKALLFQYIDTGSIDYVARAGRSAPPPRHVMHTTPPAASGGVPFSVVFLFQTIRRPIHGSDLRICGHLYLAGGPRHLPLSSGHPERRSGCSRADLSPDQHQIRRLVPGASGHSDREGRRRRSGSAVYGRG